MAVMIIVVVWMLIGYLTCGWALKDVINEGNDLTPIVVFLLSVAVLFAWPLLLGQALYRTIRERKKKQ